MGDGKILESGTSLDANLLTTATFADRELGKIRGLLRACTRPVQLSELASKYKISEPKLRQSSEKLIQTRQIFGKVLNGVYTPTSFQNLQKQAIQGFYNQNNYVEFKLCKQLMV